MTLEGFHDLLQALAVSGGHLHAIAVFLQAALQNGDGLALIAHAETLVAADRRGLDPEPDAGARKPLPIEPLAGVALAPRRDVGMRQHPLRWNGPAAQDVETQRLHRAHLRVGKFAIAELVARIVDLDADGARIEVGLTRPIALARVPGALALRHHLGDAPLFIDEVMGRDLRLRAGQPFEGRVGRFHAGVMQDQHVGCASFAPGLMVRRRDPQRGELGVGGGGHRWLSPLPP